MNTRRRFIGMSLSVGLLPLTRTHASEEEAQLAVEKIVGKAFVKSNRVKLDIPPLVENGNLVPMTVAVDSPMTANDFVKAIHIVAEGNPLPNIISFYLSARSGRATVQSRIRLSNSQRVLAIAEMSDGSFHQGFANTLVTLSACTEV